MQDILRSFLIPAALLAALTLSGGTGRAQGDKPAEPPGEDAGPAEAPVQITVLAPRDAEIFFDGEPTVLKGAERHFVCPPLPIGKTYHYEVLARWKEGDKKVEETRRVAVTGGAAVRVDFLAPPPANKDERNAVGRSVGPAGRLFHRGGGAANA